MKAFLPSTGEEVVLIPEWLRLKMISSNVQRLEDVGEDMHVGSFSQFSPDILRECTECPINKLV